VSQVPVIARFPAWHGPCDPCRAEEDAQMALETLVTFVVALGLPAWLLAEEIRHRLTGTRKALRTKTRTVPARRSPAAEPGRA